MAKPKGATAPLSFEGGTLKATKFWVTIFSGLLLTSAALSFFLFHGNTDGVMANIYQYGVCIHSIDLSRVSESYALEISGAVENTILIENGRICVAEATCPDQICVHQGWIANSVVPVVCLPNSLVIRIENTPDIEIDGVAR